MQLLGASVLYVPVKDKLGRCHGQSKLEHLPNVAPLDGTADKAWPCVGALLNLLNDPHPQPDGEQLAG